MPELPSAFLVLPHKGDRSFSKLQRKMRLLALRRLLSHPVRDLSPSTRRALRTLRRVLAEAVKRKPAHVLDAFGNPDVICPLLVLEARIQGQSAEDLIRQAVPPLLATLTPNRQHAVLSEAVLWDLPLEELVDTRGRRVANFEPAGQGVHAHPAGFEVATAQGTKVLFPDAPTLPDEVDGIQTRVPFFPLSETFPRLHLSMVDTNPLSMYEAHPDKEGNAISLGDRPAEDWVSLYREALELIRLSVPTWYAEIAHSMERLVPVGYMPERHESATYREAPGVAYVTLCDNPLTLAEAMIHETQHSKVNTLSWLDPVVHNAHTCWTESPVRPDLRPLWGVLLAVHAFVPVSAMHQRLLELDHPITHSERFPRRQAEVLAGNDRGMKAVLKSAEPSALGKKLIDEMSALHDVLMERAPPPPPGIDKDLLPPS